jgi:Flp pilus assembly protein CpaB
MAQQRVSVSMTIGALLVVALAAGGAGFVAGRQHERRSVRRDWNLVSVVVAARELPAGTVVTPDDLLVRQVPEQYVGSAVVRAEAASQVVYQTTLVALAEGDQVPWSAFEPRPRDAGR